MILVAWLSGSDSSTKQRNSNSPRGKTNMHENKISQRYMYCDRELAPTYITNADKLATTLAIAQTSGC